LDTIEKPGKTAARIVLVEDNPGDVYLLEQSLQARHIAYELIRYEDGEQVVRAMSSDDFQAPDVILVDLNLPRIEGFDILKAVRQSPRLVGVPVGVFTSSNAAKDRHRTALLGADVYIHKPGTLEEFVDQVGRAIEELLTHATDRGTN
jgi:chemotaxis family two-component system response regulator Rcp1